MPIEVLGLKQMVSPAVKKRIKCDSKLVPCNAH